MKNKCATATVYRRKFNPLKFVDYDNKLQLTFYML